MVQKLDNTHINQHDWKELQVPTHTITSDRQIRILLLSKSLWFEGWFEYRTEQIRMEQNRLEWNRTEQIRMEQNSFSSAGRQLQRSSSPTTAVLLQLINNNNKKKTYLLTQKLHSLAHSCQECVGNLSEVISLEVMALPYSLADWWRNPLEMGGKGTPQNSQDTLLEGLSPCILSWPYILEEK